MNIRENLPPVTEVIRETHPTRAIREARKIQRNFPFHLLEDRQQITWVTIDSLESPDLDDGIHIEKLPEWKWWRLFVNIASPTELIPENGDIEKEMMRRATSIYFWGRHIHHMLPNIISTDLASLNHNEYRLTLTLELEINKDFEVVNRDLYKSTFYNRQRHSPESFTHAFNNSSSGEHEYFTMMHELAVWLRQQRENEFRITAFDDSDRRITMWQARTWYTNSHISSFVIQEFMTLANIQTAEIMQEESINGLYRLHMPEYEGVLELPKRLDRAEYSPNPWFHRWLWLPLYMHSTSPIRRQADYESQRAIIAFLDDREQPNYIENLADHINAQVTAITWWQRNALLDMYGKRIVRRSEKKQETWFDLGARSHIDQRLQDGLRPPKSVRDKIISDIEINKHVDEWVIRRFLLSDEKEIVEAIKNKIRNSTKAKRYINVLNQVDGIHSHESLVRKFDGLYVQVSCKVGNANFSSSTKISSAVLEVEEILESKWNEKEIFIRKKQDIFRAKYRNLSQARYTVRRKALMRMLEVI